MVYKIRKETESVISYFNKNMIKRKKREYKWFLHKDNLFSDNLILLLCIICVHSFSVCSTLRNMRSTRELLSFVTYKAEKSGFNVIVDWDRYL